MKKFNKTTNVSTTEKGIVLQWESWKAESKESSERKDIMLNEKVFSTEEELIDFITANYKVKPTDIEVVESCLKSIERQAKKAWPCLQRITKSMKSDSPFSEKIYGVIKNAYISYVSRMSGFDFSQLLGINPAKLTQYDPTPDEVADLAKV